MTSAEDTLIEAASKGQLDTFKSLVQLHVESSPQTARNSIDRLASEAARHRHPDVLQYCLDQGANVKSHSVYTGVLDSASLEIYKVVIPCGFDPNYDPDNIVGGPLIWAVSSNNIPLTTYLLEHGGADPNEDLQTMRYRPLAKAAMANSIQMIEMLIGHGAHINESGALLIAAERGHIEAVRCLIGYKEEGSGSGDSNGGPNVDLDLHRWRDTMLYMGPQDEQTALHKAVKGGHEGIVKLLVESGADVNLTDMDGQTALEIARGIKTDLTMVQILEDGQSARKQNCGLTSFVSYP